MNRYPFPVAAGLAALLLSGCGGYNRLYLATKTNVGLDVDTQPPTAEVTIARRELGIQPTFRNTNPQDTHNALPLLGSFSLQGNWFSPEITGNFAGGDAAVKILSVREPLTPEDDEEGDDKKVSDREEDSGICIRQRPEIDRSFWEVITGAKKNESGDYAGDRRPFFFATDTTFGLKAAWSGTTGPYPDSVKLGYNRKEFASAPVYVNKGCLVNGRVDESAYNVHSPSFLARIENKATLGSFFESGITHRQVFATGKAATLIAQRPGIRQLFYQHIEPDAAAYESAMPQLNRDLLKDIKANYQNADAAGKQAILDKAIELRLVKEGTTAVKLLGELDNTASSLEPGTAHALYQLRDL